MKCRHTKRRYWTLLGYPCDAAQAGYLVCDDCDDLLPLGPSDESDPRVAMELRAAELATERDISAAWLVGRISDTERDGWSCAESNMADHSDAWHAGYLARVMVEG